MTNFENLEKLGQTQLLRFFEELNEAQRNSLIKQINQTDFSLLDELNRSASQADEGEIAPLGAMECTEIASRRAEFEEIGLKAIRERKVAALLLGGGQGTRLGYSGPKGTFNIGETRDYYIYQAQIETMLSVCEKAGAFFPLFIMTSEKNDEETRSFLKAHSFFGYPEKEIHFYVQSMAATCDFDGKVYLEAKDRLSLSPDGNGGFFRSLMKSGLDSVLREEGIEWLNVFAIDNVLQKICDPAFIGATILSGTNCGAKVVRKVNAGEKVGVLCSKGNKPTIVEYFEMGEELSRATDEKGELLYQFGVILNYLFRVDQLYKVVNEKMPLHINRKKIPHIDANGNPVVPTTENGYKFEYLATDMVREMESCLPYEVVRENEFAPVKNKEGTDSVDTARALLKQNGIEL